jgi:hypothetical protein
MIGMMIPAGLKVQQITEQLNVNKKVILVIEYFQNEIGTVTIGSPPVGLKTQTRIFTNQFFEIGHFSWSLSFAEFDSQYFGSLLPPRNYY